ncbi:RNA 2',3'-cyclic phosphodiesterase [Cellulomonas fimi]|uniref:RNA 2',3'-cyclic phosphodiesterase n=1 Tax=Cellulomonas fimi (strain ATCC 484 / DSM 20113 / JCM 1341 / CCUG 24087 / LMG 16345 / NBRC 15513 / NCIMB 8980 / NCTC 7547 / NRS-133) TaxID=590998 RepID=F4H7U7_CELFA|nr:RNA 2',3'-cyclic phosphodiesterase [Cellulomonas fimi]AEE45781.1 2'-5' RNA ligase [Cellulomonas fimi ATCC 484]NNH08559.1 RNA 2',3'-cyclic phosphodiesterase [Cellulomonas fimi]VEH30581.1 2'-5' RNA ligase [Cellulomonas fimi]
MRLFAAVWPPDEVLDHLDLALATVRGGPAGASTAVRWSARETWHLTAAFYGELPDGAVPGLTADLAAAARTTRPYSLTLRGAGVFSHRTMWVGVGGDVDAQRALSAACVAAGVEAGAVPDRRPRDRPHLTVARIRPGARPPRRGASRPGRATGPAEGGGARGPRTDEEVARGVARALAVYQGPSWQVDALQLVESRPGAGRGGGPLYEVVDELPFG